MIEGDCFQLELFVDVDGLTDVIGSVEDYERVAGDVGLYICKVSFDGGVCWYARVVQRSGSPPTSHGRELAASPEGGREEFRA